jgi:tRNA(fMet)-specific endonuclease VapC
MKFLLDTNTVSYYLRGNPATVRHVKEQKPSELAVSTITVMELTHGVEKRQSKELAAVVRDFLCAIGVLPFDQEAARHAGAVRASLEKTGFVLDAVDSQIAGHALALDLILISSDSAFKKVRGLKLKNWS